MPRPRSPQNLNLPNRWTYYHEAYYYQVPPGMEQHWNFKRKFRLGKTLEEATKTYDLMISMEALRVSGGVPLEEAEDIIKAATPFHTCGVYFLILGDEVVYVGRSTNVPTRIGEHVQAGRIAFDRVFTLPAQGLEQQRLEQRYIASLKPKFNTYGAEYFVE